MTKELLHCCTGVLARVYVRVCSERGVHSMGVLGTTACRCVLSTGVLDITIHICHTITAGSAHALVCAQFVDLCLYIFDAGGSVLGCMRVYAHTHTYCTWGARCEPRGQDETFGGPEESR